MSILRSLEAEGGVVRLDTSIWLTDTERGACVWVRGCFSARSCVRTGVWVSLHGAADAVLHGIDGSIPPTDADECRPDATDAAEHIRTDTNRDLPKDISA